MVGLGLPETRLGPPLFSCGILESITLGLSTKSALYYTVIYSTPVGDELDYVVGLRLTDLFLYPSLSGPTQGGMTSSVTRAKIGSTSPKMGPRGPKSGSGDLAHLVDRSNPQGAQTGPNFMGLLSTAPRTHLRWCSPRR